MVSTMVQAFRYEGNPLNRLATTMKWGISFGENEIQELEKYLEIIGPLEQMFNSFNSEKTSNIQKIIPSIKVKSVSLKLLFVCFCFLENAEDS